MSTGVIYSLGNKFASSGIGTTAYYGAWGLYRHGILRRILCGAYQPSALPASLIRAIGWPNRILCKLASLEQSGLLWHLQATIYDRWAARLIEQANIFHVWGGYGARSLQQAKVYGMTTVVQIASSHPHLQYRLLREEFARWGLPWKAPAASFARTLSEIAQADYILIPSDFVQDSFTAEGVSETKLIQIPFGVDCSRFMPATQSGSRPFRAVFVGQVDIRKGIPYLLEAWKRLVLCQA